MGLSRNFAKEEGLKKESDDHLAGDDPKEDRAGKGGMKNYNII